MAQQNINNTNIILDGDYVASKISHFTSKKGNHCSQLTVVIKNALGNPEELNGKTYAIEVPESVIKKCTGFTIEGFADYISRTAKDVIYDCDLISIESKGRWFTKILCKQIDFAS